MTKELERAAWNLRPLPDGLCDIEQKQFVLMRCVYRGFKLGLDTEDSAKSLKGFIVRLSELPQRDVLGLILPAYVMACEAQQSGDKEALGDMIFLENWNHDLIGKPPYNPFLDK